MESQTPQPSTQGENIYAVAEQPQKRGGLIALIFVFTAVAVGAGWYGYTSYAKNPERVLAKVIENIEEITSFEYTSSITVNAESKTLPPQLGLLGGNIEEKDSYKGSITLSDSGKGTIDDEDVRESDVQTEIGVSISGDTLDQDISIGLEVRRVDGTTYLQLTEAPTISFFSLEPFANKWLIFDPKETLSGFGVGKDEIKEAEEKVNDIKEEEERIIIEALRNGSLYSITDVLSDEVVNDADSYHYAFTANKEGVISLSVEIEKLVNEEEMSEERIEERREEMREVLNQFSEISGDIWISKKQLL
jgi:hypothetical protein